MKQTALGRCRGRERRLEAQPQVSAVLGILQIIAATYAKMHWHKHGIWGKTERKKIPFQRQSKVLIPTVAGLGRKELLSCGIVENCFIP